MAPLGAVLIMTRLSIVLGIGDSQDLFVLARDYSLDD